MKDGLPKDRSMSGMTHEDYFATCSPEACARLLRIQRAVERRVPGALRCFAYRMPAFRQARVFFYFAAFKQHIGIYPPLTDDAALVAETAPWRGPRGNLSFPLREELPLDLVGRVAEALARQYGGGPPRKKALRKGAD